MAYTDAATVKLLLNDVAGMDSLIQESIDAAAAAIDRRAGRSFDRLATAAARTFRTSGRVVCDSDGELLIVDDIADESVTVEIGRGGGAFTALADGFELEPLNAIGKAQPATGIRRLEARWSTDPQVRITAVWGWPEVPAPIVEANKLQAIRLYMRKGSPDGVRGSAEWGLIQVPHLDPDVRALVDAYRLPGFG